MTAIRLLALAALLAACHQNPVAGPPRETTEAAELPATTVIVGPAGWGSVRVGMGRARAIEAMGGVDGSLPPAKDDVGTCYYVIPRGVDGVRVMIENGKVARVDVFDGAVNTVTDTGLRLGVTADEVRARYGAAAQYEPHKYDPAPAAYLTVWDPRARQGVRYVVSTDGVVHGILAGGPAIRYVEGCS